MTYKLSPSLRKIRQDFKTLILQTSFIGQLIDNIKYRQGSVLDWTSLGPVQQVTDYAEASRKCRRAVVTAIHENCKFWSMEHGTSPLTLNDDILWKQIKALVLSPEDTDVLSVVPAGQEVNIGGGYTITKTESNVGIVGTLYMLPGFHVPVYGTDTG